MPLCPRCNAENAEHMIACWRCAYPVYPPQVADEIARRRREAEAGREPRMLPSETVPTAVQEMPPEAATVGEEAPEATPTTAVEGALPETTTIVEEAQAGVAAGAEELPTEALSESLSEGAVETAELAVEPMEAAKEKPKAAAPVEVAPTPKAVRGAPAAAVPAKVRLKSTIPFALAGAAVVIIITGAFILIPKMFQSPQKVVNEFLSAVKAGDSERIKALVTKSDREEIEKAGGTAQFAPLQNVEFEVGGAEIKGSEATVKVKFKIASPIKLEFEAPFICTREGLSWKINGKRTVTEVINAATAAAIQQWSTMLQEALKKGIFPIPKK